MFDFLLGFIPEKLIIIGTVLAFVIPYAVYRINQKLLEKGNPPWKKDSYNG